MVVATAVPPCFPEGSGTPSASAAGHSLNGANRRCQHHQGASSVNKHPEHLSICRPHKSMHIVLYSSLSTVLSLTLPWTDSVGTQGGARLVQAPGAAPTAAGCGGAGVKLLRLPSETGPRSPSPAGTAAFESCGRQRILQAQKLGPGGHTPRVPREGRCPCWDRISA